MREVIPVTTITLHSRIDPEGLLHVRVPAEWADSECDVTVTVSDKQANQGTKRTEWLSFIQATAGQWQGEPLVRPPQGEYEVRDEIQ